MEKKMKKQQLTANEVKEVVESVRFYLSDLKSRWDEEKPKLNRWFGMSREYLVKGTMFIMKSIDEMIQYVEGVIPVGKDKKEVVMAVAGNLFDYVIAECLPIWMKPMKSTIRKIIIDVLVSQMIDLIVEKYNSGFWNKKNEEKQKV